MTLYIFQTNNRNYETWNILNATTLEPIHNGFDDFNPIQHKLLNNDVFTFNKGKVDIITSRCRTSENIAAVLILENNKTYGRENKTSLKEGRLLYKCVPNDITIPIFLVPYEIKQMGFSKVLTNLYVTIRFKNWTEKHPHAILSQNIGSVDNLEHFYEYQLYCKNLNLSIQNFNKSLNKAIKKYTDSSIHESIIDNLINSYPQFEDRTLWKVFTIDPEGSDDFDDGFSIRKLDSDHNKILLSIYISNVTIWLDFLNLWPAFSERTSTIYLPNRKIPMLPTLLSDCLCSLQAKSRRFAFTMDLIINSEFNIESINFSNSLIKVFKNYVYEEDALLLDLEYRFLFYTSTCLLKKYNYIESINDSHDVVSYLMIFMNYNCALELLKNGNGLFRCVTSSTSKNDVFPPSLPQHIKQFIKVYGSSSASYFNPEGKNISTEQLKQLTRHDMLQLDAYIHITSPIRRIVDLLNMIKIQTNKLLIPFSHEAETFYNTWSYKIDYINSSMRSIRQLQNDCNLLHMFYSNNDILKSEYEGYCFDKIVTGNKNNLFQYMAYLPELRITSKIITIHDFDNYSPHKFKLFLFFNEEKFKKKIRLEIIL
jgi:exoribonuclease R